MGNPFRDLTGMRFERWTVESRADDYIVHYIRDGKKITGKYTQWNCMCDCGNRRVVLGTNLTKGRSKSCGCYKSEVSKVAGKGQRLEPRFKSLAETPSTREILALVLGDDQVNDDAALEKAVVEMFPYWWQRKVRDEQTVIRRYGNKENTICEKCGKQAKLDMHHIRPMSEFGGNDRENVMWVCKECHTEIEREKLCKK